MNDLTHSRTYNNVFYGEENRPVSNKITVRHNRVGEQGNCQDWTNPYPKIIALDGETATFFSGEVWEHENYRAGKQHKGLIFKAVKVENDYYADKVLADLNKENSV